MKKKTLENFEPRFWSRVDKTGDCWRWLGAHNKNGYGVVGRDKKVLWCHRIAWELTNGPIPNDKVLDHLCRNVWCINPKHLDLVTQTENIRRGSLTKLTREQVLDMRHRYANGERSWIAFAKEFGIAKRYVGYLIRGQAWSDLPGACETQGRWA